GYDVGAVLAKLAELEQDFIVRACWNRRVASRYRDRVYLRDQLRRAPVVGSLRLDVPADYKRQGRKALLRVRSAVVQLELVDRYHKKTRVQTVNGVWVREERTAPRGEKPLDWMLLTNRPAKTLAQAMAIVSDYRHRWRIEEFHKTWKSDACNVEDSRL